jgi:hypothetical protein
MIHIRVQLYTISIVQYADHRRSPHFHGNGASTFPLDQKPQDEVASFLLSSDVVNRAFNGCHGCSAPDT